MTKKTVEDKQVKKAKGQLGKKISEYRQELETPLSMRKLAEAIELSPSNMKYIEDGVNAPSQDVYAKIIKELKPPPKKRRIMDQLYSRIRKTPPPDICETINNNQNLFDVFRLIDNQILSKKQILQVEELFKTFTEDNKGEIENGK